MATGSVTARSRLEAQGFVDLDDLTLAQVGPWLRLAPAICALWTAIGTVLASPAVIWALVPFAVLGAAMRGHPFDVIYNSGIRRLLGAPRLPPYRAPRRFACGVASVWLSATGLAFFGGWTAVGYGLGAGLVGAMLLVATTDFCMASFFYNLIFGKPTSGESGRS